MVKPQFPDSPGGSVRHVPEHLESSRIGAEHLSLPRTLSHIVHELRTPVTIVAGYLRMLLKEQAGPVTDKQRKMLEEAEKSCARLTEMIRDVSDYGKLISGEAAVARQDVDLAALVAELASDMHEGDDRGVRLELRGVDRPIVVTGDRTRLAAALRALTHETMRQQGEAGVVVVECSVNADTDPPSALVAIGDEEHLPAVKQMPSRDERMFYNELRGGAGMTLYQALRVIGDLGGELWSVGGDHPKRGTALRLPLKHAELIL